MICAHSGVLYTFYMNHHCRWFVGINCRGIYFCYSFGGAQKRGQPWTRSVDRSSVPVAAVRDRFLCAAVVRATRFFTARAYRTHCSRPRSVGENHRIGGRVETHLSHGHDPRCKTRTTCSTCDPSVPPSQWSVSWCRIRQDSIIISCIYNCACINDTTYNTGLRISWSRGKTRCRRNFLIWCLENCARDFYIRSVFLDLPRRISFIFTRRRHTRALTENCNRFLLKNHDNIILLGTPSSAVNIGICRCIGWYTLSVVLCRARFRF